MWIIVLSILAALVLTFVGTKIFAKSASAKSDDNEEFDQADVDCCGAHEVCDKETLLSADDEIVYYDDEELDRFKSVPPNNYSCDQIEEFREILYTMKDEEVAGWLRSLNLRGVNPPSVVREEALMIVSEVREIIRT
ncbi:hypothetical protein QA597_11660 [Marinilabiliaceae bacterium ANBcel2]|nr:hypothetical protein [Marinilabiliaceae bacterium ANBcel2]